MPYISPENFDRVRDLLIDEDLVKMEQDIYSLNRQIRAFPGEDLTSEWRALKDQHSRLIEAYRRAGGTRL